MATIRFTDADGVWLLHNAKPFPASRFGNWMADSAPIGDAANRQSDGLLTMFRLRTDYGASFELSMIPMMRSTNLVLQSENFGTTWAAVGTPTRTPAAHTLSGVTLDLIGDDSGASAEYYSQTVTFTGNAAKAMSVFAKAGVIQAASGALFQLVDVTAAAFRLDAVLAWTAGGVPSVGMGTGTYLGYEQRVDGVYRLLFQTTAVTAANTNSVRVGGAGSSTEQGNIYAGGVQAENALAPTPYLATTSGVPLVASMTEIADRLCFHLRNGGTCAVYTGDAVGSTYATCSLRPGTEPSLQLDRRLMESTLQLSLINVAGSPVRMVARYAE